MTAAWFKKLSFVALAFAVVTLSTSLRADKPVWAGGNGNASTGTWTNNGATVAAPGNSDIAHIDNGKADYNGSSEIGALELTFDSVNHTTGAIGGSGTVTFLGGVGLASTWDAGEMSFTGGGGAVFGASATLTIKGSTSHKLSGGSLTNNGLTNWDAGTVETSSGTTINNNSGATFSTSFDGDLTGSSTFSNAGTFTKSGSTGGATDIQSSFNNSGSINASAGTLRFSGGGSSSGTVAVGSGAEVDIGTNDFAISGGAITGNSGKVKLLDHITTFSGTTSGDAELNVAGGTATFTGTHSGTGKLTLQSGTVDGTGTATFNALDWSGGNVNSKVTATVSAASGSGTKTIGSSGDLTIAGATSGSSAWTGTLSNSGKFTHASGSTDLQGALTNTNTITASAGTLRFSGGGSSSGTVAVGSGAEVDIGTNDFAISGGAITGNSGKVKLLDHTTTFSGTTSGDAELHVAGGTAAFTGTHSGTGKLSLASGTVTSSGSGAASFGSLDWQGGSVDGKITSNGNSAASGTDAKTIGTAGELTLAGATTNTWAGGTITNQGKLNQNAGSTDIRTAFNNSGSVNANGGTLTFSGGGSSSGTLSVGSGAEVQIATADFAITGGAINGSNGKVKLQSAVTTFTNATSGDTELAVAGGTARFDGTHNGTGKLSVASGTVSGTGTASFGSLDFTGGTLSAKVTSNGATALTGSARTLAGGELTLNGNTAWDGSPISASGAARIQNNAGKTFSANADGLLANSGTAAFKNDGTFTKSAGASNGATEIQAVFDNTGTVNANAGTLKLSGGGSSSGTIALGSGAEVQIASNDFAITGGAINGNSGKLKLVDHTTTFSGSTSGDAELAVTGGTANFTGTHSGSGKLTLTSGSVTSGGTGAASFGSLDWQGGSVNGKVTSNGNAAASGANAKTIGTGGELTLAGSTTNTWAGGAVTNQGKLNHNAGTTDIQAAFTNSGRVTVNAGQLTLSGGGASSGELDVTGTNSEIAITHGFSLASGAKVNGKIRLTGGILNALGTLDVNGLLLEGGSVTGSQTFQGLLSWLGGDFNNLDVTTLAGGTTFNITSGSDHAFDGHSFINHGTVNWTGGRLRGASNASFLNASDGVFNDNASSALTDDGGGAKGFTNLGRYNKLTTGTTTISIPFENDSGTLYVSAGTLRFSRSFTQKSGTLNLTNVTNGSVLQFDQGLTIASGGTLAGTGTVVGSVTAAGTIAPGNSPGLITVTGTLTLQSTSVLLFELGGTTPGTGYDFLSISGDASLGAANLTLAFTNNFQSSVTSLNTFTVLTAATLTGAFANVANGTRLLTTDGFGSFQVNYGAGSLFAANSVVLSNFAAVPEPSACALLVVGLGVVALAVRRRAPR